MPRRAETALFRIMQEALTNVVKHSRARRVSVCVEYGQKGAEPRGGGLQPRLQPTVRFRASGAGRWRTEDPPIRIQDGRSRTVANDQRSLRDREVPGSNPGPRPPLEYELTGVRL